MSTVTLTIGPKTYSVACADGQEAHITQLGTMVAEKYAQLGASRAPLEAQNLLFASLFLADELAEARKTIAATPAPAAVDSAAAEALRTAIAELERDLAEARTAAAAAASAPPAAPSPDLFGAAAPQAALTEELALKLEALADRAEANAAALEAAAASA